MKLSKITLFYDTPMTTLNETIHFDTKEERERYFFVTSGFKKVSFEGDFNLVKDRLTLRLPIPYEDCDGINYGHFKDGFTGKDYYFYVMTTQYANEKVTMFQVVVDVLMTFTQGNVLSGLGNVTVNRQHLTQGVYSRRLRELKTNYDILNATSKRYVHSKSYRFTNLNVLIQSASSLTADFGNLEKPKNTLPLGGEHDNIVSPVGIYTLKADDFQEFTRLMSDYPWIGQNISDITLVPNEMINPDSLERVKLNDKETPFDFYRFKNGYSSKDVDLSSLSMTKNEVLSALKIPKDEEYLLRSGYFTCEIYNWNGESLLVDLADMPETGINFNVYQTLGFNNEMKVYLEDWHQNGDTEQGGFKRGSFLNNSIGFSDFTKIPLLIDNYKLSLANNANTIAYNNSQTMSGRAKNIGKTIFDPNQSLIEKATNIFTDAYSLMGGGLSITNIGGKIANDTEYYRKQRAEFADLSLTPATVQPSNKGFAFNIGNGIFGLTMKFSAPTDAELEKIRKYYSMMGFEFNEKGIVDDIHSMTICNYLQIDGQFKINGIPTQYMEQLKALLMAGVRFWHFNNKQNPLLQNPLENKRRNF